METKAALSYATVDALKQLAQINIDSAKGFREAADEIDNKPISNQLKEISEVRERQAEELGAYIEYNDETPRDSSYAAAVHRGWMKARSCFSDNNLYAVLAEAERGEDVIKEAYEEALKDNPGSAMNDVLNKQYARVKADHDHVRDLRDTIK
ncbi:PA2169 family four-helix-bundle protein [Calycomorphotria hydatis]|uniref:DUF2383 domain-containing protein n=1 Tax=Calycomorphotria hydatis TaxID=2528027 RepID=A0A517T642_9PLAN|nr:PA2169 family four-helix-bundle protein [Calycomorphotria hydatis]QDT63852.1 hypothetical protein V22_10770 [Calycomorphotria hydatis]